MYNKVNDFSFIRYVLSFDIICLTETFVDSSFNFDIIFHDFVKFVHPAKKISQRGRNSGGVLLLIRKSLSEFISRVNIECDNTVAVKFKKSVFNSDKDIVLIATYVIPENGSLYDTMPIKDGIVNLEESLLQVQQSQDVHIIIVGDLNARTGCKQPCTENMISYDNSAAAVDDDDDDNDDDDSTDDIMCRNSKDNTVNNFGQSLLDMCFLFNCVILNGLCKNATSGDFTYVSPHGSSVIDYVIMSKDLFSFACCEMYISDRIDSWHLPVEFIWKNVKHIIQVSEADDFVADERFVWTDDCLHQYQNEQMSAEFKHNLQEAFRTVATDIDHSLKMFVNSLFGAAACMIRMTGVRKSKNEWFDEECHRKKKRVRGLLRKFKRAKTAITEKRMEYVNERKEYKLMLKQKKDTFDKLRLAKLKQSIHDPKLFWQTVRSLSSRKLIYHSISSDQWYEHFSYLFKADDDSTSDSNSSDEEEAPDVIGKPFNETISKQEVLASINNLKSGKSAGPDKIIAELLKNANACVIDYLVIYFNKLFDSGVFPKEWAKSIIIPIHKKGDVNQPDNYRGIALTSVISKIYTHILTKRLTLWAKNEDRIIEEQAGFREGYSTIDHIFTLYSIVHTFLSKKSKLYVAFVDFKKAFDSVNRNSLWAVLRKTGVNGKMYLALRSIYDSVLASVRDKGRYTDYFHCPKGVKQGCLLSPLLFSFFINELAIEVSKTGRHGIQLIPGAIEIFLLLFADDIILLSDTIIGLQNQLNSLKREADRLELTVNLDKTNIMVFRMGGYLGIRERWFYGNNELKVTNAYKYLGMIFTTKLSISNALSEVCKKGKRGVIEIQRCLNKVKSMDCDLFWKMFDTQIVPLLTYAAEVWGLHEDSHKIETVHTFAIKRLLFVPLHTSNELVYGETGRYPLFINIYSKCIRYWLKLTRLPPSRICRQAYDMLKLKHEYGENNWVSNIKKVLCENGFGVVWLSQGVGNEYAFLAEFKDRLVSCYKQKWHASLEEKDKFRWYHSFKDVFEVEKYLLFVTNKIHRNSLTKFRLRVSGLQNMKLWFLNEERVDGNVCPSCESAAEDEIHFLFQCAMYADIRINCEILGSSTGIADQNHVARVLSCTNQKDIISLARFISEAMNVRTRRAKPIRLTCVILH